jgi:alpha-L-rhamnosidase
MLMDSFATKKITHPKPNIWIYDMGQNMAGIPCITVKGANGSTVKITPGELLSDSGLVTQQATGSPYYLSYTLSGKDNETWHPDFTYYGFRYLQVEGAEPISQANGSLPAIVKMQSLHIRNSAKTAGHFYCSNTLFNKTFDLINWSIKSNMVSIFTDCPTREKLGWLEQDHLMANSIRYNYDVVNLFRQELNVMKSAQLNNGMIPDIAPEYVPFDGGFRDSPEWGSTGVLLPWYIYQWYGDKSVLQKSYDMIKRYVDYLSSQAKNHIVNYGLGDWYDIGPKNPGKAQLTPLTLTATAYYYYDTKILADIAIILNQQADAVKYSEQAATIKQAYNANFFNKETKSYSSGSQTSNAISIYMGLVEPQNKQAVVDNLVADVRKNNNAITAGDIGFRYLLKVLADEGHSDVIFDMNSRADVPGYGYQLAHGATSLTESWQAYRFVSNNHLMLGHLMEWFYNDLAGIQYPDASGSSQFTIKPQPVGDVTFARADYASPYGIIKTDWQVKGKAFALNVTIPANTTANICLPKAYSKNISENGKPVSSTVIVRGSGIYHFDSTAY